MKGVDVNTQVDALDEKIKRIIDEQKQENLKSLREEFLKMINNRNQHYA